MTTVQELFDRALELSPRERGELGSRILESAIPDPPGDDISQDEWEREWGDEIEARIGRFERGETQALSWDAVYAELKTKFAREAK